MRRTVVALDMQAELCLLLSELKHLVRDQTTIQVDVGETIQVTGEGGARQFLLQCSKLTHIPNALTILGEHLVLREGHHLLRKVAEPRGGGTRLVAHHVFGGDGIAQNCLGIFGIPPHMRHKCSICHFNASTAQPAPQGLVDVLAAPGDHLGVIATSLFPPSPAQREQTSTHQWSIAPWVVEPSKVIVPKDEAHLSTASTWNLFPGIGV
mmetsp:Transcript_68311/g.107339  ORF Transcript_68311/g.107339 Transcript_68311/m.107339 type:complete len:209 (+) Transcript_68311:1367-1993(+)